MHWKIINSRKSGSGQQHQRQPIVYYDTNTDNDDIEQPVTVSRLPLICKSVDCRRNRRRVDLVACQQSFHLALQCSSCIQYVDHICNPEFDEDVPYLNWIHVNIQPISSKEIALTLITIEPTDVKNNF
jgi:hypothetical protein